MTTVWYEYLTQKTFPTWSRFFFAAYQRNLLPIIVTLLPVHNGSKKTKGIFFLQDKSHKVKSAFLTTPGKAVLFALKDVRPTMHTEIRLVLLHTHYRTDASSNKLKRMKKKSCVGKLIFSPSTFHLSNFMKIIYTQWFMFIHS